MYRDVSLSNEQTMLIETADNELINVYCASHWSFLNLVCDLLQIYIVVQSET